MNLINNKMTKEIKAGDKVRVSKDTPELYTMYGQADWESVESTVKKIDGDAAEIRWFNENSDEYDYITIPTKYLIKVDAEAKEAKYNVGDRVKFKSLEELKTIKHKSFHWSLPICAGKFATIVGIDDVGGYIVDIDKNGRGYIDDMIEAKVEPKEQTDAENQAITLGEWVVTPYGYGVVGKDIEGRIAVALEYGGFCGIDKAIKIIADNPVFDWDTYAADLAKEMEGCDNIVSIKEKIRNLHRENNQGLHFNPFRCNNFANAVGESDYWKHYASNLAKEVVLKVANKYEDPKKAAEYAVQVAKAVVEGLKKK